MRVKMVNKVLIMELKNSSTQETAKTFFFKNKQGTKRNSRWIKAKLIYVIIIIRRKRKKKQRNPAVNLDSNGSFTATKPAGSILKGKGVVSF